MYAHCLKSGQIVLDEAEDIGGYICFAEGTEGELKAKLDARARLSWDNEWLVPGLPEAETDEQALRAVEVFQERMEER